MKSQAIAQGPAAHAGPDTPRARDRAVKSATARPAVRRRPLLRLQQSIPRKVYVTLSILGFVLPLVAWELLSRSGLIDTMFLPTPGDVIEQGWTWAHSSLAQDTWASIVRVVSGFVLAACLGVPLGVFIGSFKAVEGFFQPINDFVRYMPAAAFIPLMILWVGIGEGSKIAIIFIGVFFQIIVMVADVVRQVPGSWLEASYTLGATRGEALRLVIWRGSLPPLINILRVNMGWAWTYLVVAEMVAANKGLGYAILQAQRFMNTSTIFAGILIIGVIGLLFDLFFRQLHRRLFPWLH
ncbi:ABC transporter permease [Salinisphaera hydrothermalis]|uniref:Putative Nitrate transport permease protein nrtB n=1 Tax=Salinisphaera hydrothermalis (strain C41B8) TaxID=1304275 RepID=A0A084IRB7_SALHC|nr:ABC transporter permease [Salinisphaera hydrothermalis]KEZ79251.1 putative Nitrate transport permease protein nrtB [Salinisphaera hydrothermalis C41B8]